jgi:AmiR/NasT family two-component response regulator
VGDNNGQGALRILLADQDPGALRVTAGQVRELGHTPTEIAVSLSEAAEAIARDDPDLTIVVIYGDDQYALGLIEEIDAFSSGPVIALLDREDPEFVDPERHRGRHAPLARAR